MAKKKEESVIEKIKDSAADVFEKTEEIAQEIAESVEKNVKKAGKKIEKAMPGVKKEIKELAEKAEESAEKAIKKASEKVGEAIDVLRGEEEKPVKKKTKLEELKEKAKALEKKVKDVEKINIKERVRGEKEEEGANTLVPVEDYLKSSMHLGTRVITPHMRPFIYKRRADGLAVFNTNLLDQKIREAADYLVKFNPEDIILVCKREAGWPAAKKFGEMLGIKTFTKKYPSGVLTNTNLENFFECELVFICDPWLDKNALADANRIKIAVLGICDSNNYHFGMNQVIIGNNKSAKSLGMMFYLLAKVYIEKRGLDVPAPKIEDFVDDWENLVPPK